MIFTHKSFRLFSAKPLKMDNLAFLGDVAPGFAVRGSQVRVLTEPSEFYSQLCARAERAQSRIAMAALYLGTGDKAQQLVESVRKSLVSSEGKTKTIFLLDYCRGNRNVEGKSSCTMLQPLLQEYRDACTVSLFHTPNLRGIWKKLIPGKYNETIGLQHCKLYVFDDTVLMSGANLSTDYFTNRQDRYILIEDCAPLADFCEGLVHKISEFSLELQNDGSFKMPSTWKGGHPYKGDYDTFIKAARSSINNWLSSQHQEHKLAYDSKTSLFDRSENGADTWIFPSIQMGHFGIRHDSMLTTKLLESGTEGSKFKFATGYFNITRDYQRVIAKSSSVFDILCAHQKANGFYGARFPIGGIPHAYSLISRQFLQSVQHSLSRVRMFEYFRPGWTFHAKGLWFYAPSSNLPVATMIGSTNYGYRSVEKDLETNLTIVTTNKQLQEALEAEQKRLFNTAEVVTMKHFEENPTPLWVKCVVGLFRKLF